MLFKYGNSYFFDPVSLMNLFHYGRSATNHPGLILIMLKSEKCIKNILKNFVS